VGVRHWSDLLRVQRPGEREADAGVSGVDEGNAAAAGPTGLRGHVPAKDYDAIVKDAAVLKANYVKIEAFWTQKKVDDAIKFSKDGGMAAGDLEAAAKAKDDAGITAAMGKVTATCSGCHTAHREQLPDKTYEIK